MSHDSEVTAVGLVPQLSLLDLPLRRDQLLELIPAKPRDRAEVSVRRSSEDQPG